MQHEDNEARRPKAGLRESQAQYELSVLLPKCMERYLLHLPATPSSYLPLLPFPSYILTYCVYLLLRAFLPNHLKIA